MLTRVVKTVAGIALLCILAEPINCSRRGGASGGSGVTLAGKVVDGVVANATVTVFSDIGLTQQIGSGSTNETGDFNITLSTQPSGTFFVKSEGGTDTETGLPAPTMILAATLDSGQFNVTPISNRAFTEIVKNPSLTPSEAFETVANKLGISPSSAMGDPSTDMSAQSGVDEILSAANTCQTLPDGTYTAKFIYVLKNQMRSLTIPNITDLIKTFTLTVSGGSIFGSSDIDSDGRSEIVTGRVQGCTLIMVFDEISEVFNMTGDIIFGSSVGIVNRVPLPADRTSITFGAYLCEFIPDSMTAAQIDTMFSVASKIYTGTYFYSSAPFLFDTFVTCHYGKMNVSSFTKPEGSTSGGFSFDQMLVKEIRKSSGAGFEARTTFDNMSGSASLIGGSKSKIWMFRAGDLKNTSGVTMSQLRKDGSVGPYVLGILGNRNGLVVDIDSSGVFRGSEFLLVMKDTDIAQQLEPGTYKDITVFARVSDIGSARAKVIAEGGAVESGTIIVRSSTDFPGMNIGYYYDPANDENVVAIGPRFISINYDDTGEENVSKDGSELLNLENYDSGAQGGYTIEGGTDGEIDFADFVLSEISFLKREGETPADIKGTFNFIARTMYKGDIYDDGYKNSFIYGVMTLDTSALSASFRVDGPSSERKGTFVFNVEKLNHSADGKYGGVVHIHGAVGSSYLDFYYALGARKAIYFVSSAANGVVKEIGEAFFTY